MATTLLQRGHPAKGPYLPCVRMAGRALLAGQHLIVKCGIKQKPLMQGLTQINSERYEDKPRHAVQWRHNERDGVSNYRRVDCLHSRLFRRRSKKTSKLRVTGLFEGNPPASGGFRSQRVNDVKNVSIWWRHHDGFILQNRGPLCMFYYSGMLVVTCCHVFIHSRSTNWWQWY